MCSLNCTIWEPKRWLTHVCISFRCTYFHSSAPLFLVQFRPILFWYSIYLIPQTLSPPQWAQGPRETILIYSTQRQRAPEPVLANLNLFYSDAVVYQGSPANYKFTLFLYIIYSGPLHGFFIHPKTLLDLLLWCHFFGQTYTKNNSESNNKVFPNENQKSLIWLIFRKTFHTRVQRIASFPLWPTLVLLDTTIDWRDSSFEKKIIPELMKNVDFSVVHFFCCC